MDILRILDDLHTLAVEQPKTYLGMTFGLNKDEISMQIAKVRASLPNELKHLQHAFQVRHICIHNYGRVDSSFASATKLPVNVGDTYVVTQGEYRSMFDSYALFLKHIDTSLAHGIVP